MKLESTCYANHKLVINDQGTPIAVQIDGVEAFRLYDTVKVTGDCRGYICPGIEKPGIGQIVEIRRDTTDHFYGVKMTNGEFGYLKYNRIERCY